MTTEEWASIDDIVSDADAVREFVIEYKYADGSLRKSKVYYCELTGGEMPYGELAKLLDENGKPTDQAAVSEYSERMILKRLMKANGRAPSWNMTPDKWAKLPDAARAAIARGIKGAVEERGQNFQSGP